MVNCEYDKKGKSKFITMNSTKLITIGIPTFEAGESLVKTVESIIIQTYFENVKEILIVVDGAIIKKEILDKLTDKKIKIIYSKNRQGQSARINDIFNIVSTNHLILTNDDVLFDTKVVENVMNKYLDYDLISSNVKTVKYNGFFYKTLNIGQKIRSSIATNWNKGDNYLSCNGRLIILSKNLYKNLIIPEMIWNSDAYVYISASVLKLKFKYAKDIIVYYKSPSTLKEHLAQSTKFQKSLIDLQRYFNEDISSFYKVPTSIKIISICKVMLRHPLLTISYISLFIITRIKGLIANPEFTHQGYWKTDHSTKNI